jgi:transcriptional regulator with XRE-family HTH domain
MDAATLIRQARAGSDLSLRQLAQRAGTSHATLSAYEAGRIDPSVRTVQRIVRSAGFDPAVVLVPRVDPTEGGRGDELVQVLELAALFPARHARQLPYPKFGAP